MFDLVKFFASIIIYLCVSLLLSSCNGTSQNSINPTIYAPDEGNVASQTHVPIPTSSQTPQLTLESESNNATSLAYQTDMSHLTGQFYFYESNGIQQVALASHDIRYLLTEEPDWIDWGARFAQNQKKIAFWTKSVNGTEIWVSSLTEWQPERILALEDTIEYDFATPLWGVNDRYLIFNLSILDQSGPLDDVKTIRTYVIDTETMELVNPPYWPGDCSILARSPQTDQLALWCHKTQQADNSQEFLVLEPEQLPWITKYEPDSFVDNCLVYAVCAWSQDGQFVAYAVTKDHPNSFYYVSVNDPEPIRLDDKLSDYYGFPSWSPDGRLLNYSGACIEVGECPNVLSVDDQEIIWRAKNNHNRGEFGIIFEDQVIWSPDSRYIAMPILVDTDHGVDEQILVFDVITQQEKSRILFPEMDNKIQDLIWVDD